MNRFLPFLYFLLFSFTSIGQPRLKAAINRPRMPKDWAMIAYHSMMKYAPMPDFKFDHSGPEPGDTIPDFTLHTVEGRMVNIGKVLSSGKPVLMISASYTCWEYRGMIPFINQIDSMFRKSLTVLIVYTAEAHPIDTNPYCGDIYHNGGMWFEGNVAECVLYKRPRTYGERRNLVREMLNHMVVRPEVIIDGPGNEWWHYFGPAPNIAYLVHPNGVIESKYPWLNSGSEELIGDIEALLVNHAL